MKRYKKNITFILLFTTIISLLISINFDSKSEKVEEEQKEQMTYKLVKVESTEEIRGSNLYNNESLGIQFRFPYNWIVEEYSGDDCNALAKNICVKVFTNNRKNYIKISISPQSSQDEMGGGDIFDNQYNNAALIDVGNIQFLRPNAVNGLYDYESKYNISLLNVLELTQTEDKNGNFSHWVVINGKGYTFTYLIDYDQIEDRYNIGENELVSAMDQIISTLEIDFNVNPFE